MGSSRLRERLPAPASAPTKAGEGADTDGGCNGGGEQKSSGSDWEASITTAAVSEDWAPEEEISEQETPKEEISEQETPSEEISEQEVSEEEVSEPSPPAPEPAKPAYTPQVTPDPVDPAHIAEPKDAAVEELPGA